MASFLLDTHIWTWNLTIDPRLRRRNLDLINTAAEIHLSPVSFYEVAQKVRLGKWPEMEPYVGRLAYLLTQQQGRVAALTPEIAILAASLDWSRRDPFDRMIAATAILLKLPLMSADDIFDALAERKDWPGRVW